MTLRGKITAALAPVPLAFLCAVCTAGTGALGLAGSLFAAQASAAESESYTVTIPTEVSVGEPLIVTSVLPAQSNLDIALASTDDAWQLRCGGAPGIGYSVSGDNLKDNRLRHSTLDGGTFTDDLSVGLSGSAPVAPAYSGTYTDTLTFNFDFRVNSFTLTFDPGDGALTAGSDASRSVEYGAGLGALPEPTRLGYHCVGWYDAPDGGTQYTAGTAMPAADTRLYARWELNTYTVQFDANADWGGQGSVDPLPMTYGTSATLPSGEDALTNTNAVADKVRFAGWNTKQDGTGTPYADGAEVTNLAEDNGATVTLYAQWEFMHTLTVQYDKSVVDDVYAYADYTTAAKWLRPGQTLAWGPEDLLAIVDDDVEKNLANWKKEWGSNVVFPKDPTLDGAGLTTAYAGEADGLTLDRQWYYLDLNGHFGYLKKSGVGFDWWTNGTLIDKYGIISAKADVYVNDIRVGNDVTDYIKQHKYGANYQIKLTYKRSIYYCANNVMTGKVHGEKKQSSTPHYPNGYFATLVGYFFTTTSSEPWVVSNAEDTEQVSDDQDVVEIPTELGNDGSAADSAAQDDEAIPSGETPEDGASSSASDSSNADSSEETEGPDVDARLLPDDAASSSADLDVSASSDAPGEQGE